MSSTAITLPKASSPNRAKAGPADYARWYVMKRITDALPPEARQQMLDLIIQVRVVRGMYQEYADLLSQVTIDPDAYGEFLAPETLATLKPNGRAVLRNLIIKEANSYNTDLTRTLKFLADAMSRVDETDSAFVELIDTRIFSYGQ